MFIKKQTNSWIKVLLDLRRNYVGSRWQGNMKLPRTGMHFRYKKPCPTLQMKHSFPPKNSGASLNLSEIPFFSVPAHMIALDLSWICSCHEAMASSHFQPLPPLKSATLLWQLLHLLLLFIFLRKILFPELRSKLYMAIIWLLSPLIKNS